MKIKKMSKIIKTSLIFFAGLVFFLSIFIYISLEISTANEEGSMTASDLSAPVTITRDTKGVPRIKAENETDLFFALGYIHASERLWQMFTMQQLHRGRLAGSFGHKALPVDIYLRTLGLKKYVEKYYSQQTERIKNIFKAYAAGVNLYVEKCSVLPPEFYLTGARPKIWEPHDPIGVKFAMLLSLSNNLRAEISFLYLAKAALQNNIPVQELARLYPPHFNQERSFEEISKLKQINFTRISITSEMINMLQDPFLVDNKGSNSWGIAPSKTRSKKSILANDTHLEVALPPQWYIANLDSPEYKAIGFTIPGSPLIIIGYNGNISWGITILQLDSQDVFLEELRHEGEKSSYLYKGEWLPVTTSKERFKVKGKKNITKIIKSTRNGPLLNKALSYGFKSSLLPTGISSEYGIALKSVLADGDNSPQAFYDLGRSATIEEARKALSKIHGGHFNFTIANSESIHWQLVGKIPVRGSGEGHFPSPAWNGKYEWKGYISTNKNPSLHSPPDGFIATANHRVLDTLIKNNLPFKLEGNWRPDHRYNRIWEVLDQASNIDLSFVRKMQMDQRTTAFRGLKYLLLQEKESIRQASARLSDKEKGLVEKAYQILRSFDENSQQDSKIAVLYYLFLDHFLIHTFSDEFGPTDSDLWKIFTTQFKRSQISFQQLLFYTKQSRFFDNIKTSDKTETKVDIIVLSLKDALVDVWSKFSEDEKDWFWGSLHHYYWVHPVTEPAKFLSFYFNVGPFPAGGADHTINVSSYALGMRNYRVYKIPAMRFVFDFSRPNYFHAVLPTGQSGNPASSHYDDMLEDYLKGVLYDLPFGGAEADAHYKKKFILKP